MNITTLFSRIISSYKTSIVLMFIFAIVLGIATFVEKFQGTEVAKLFFYYSPLMLLIQFLLVVNFLAISSRYQLLDKEKIAFIIIHFAFIIILSGAFITHLFGKEGSIHLRENEQTDVMSVQTNLSHHFHKLPFTIKLEEFVLTKYPGSTSPSSFESFVTIEDEKGVRAETISMNSILDIKGYRLFQASYDTDEKGTILSVNQDVAGRTISYIGYSLLVIGFLLSFITKNSRFSQLINQLKKVKAIKSVLLIGLLLSPTLSIRSNSSIDINNFLQNHKIPEEHATQFGALPMQARDGRIKPINTFSSEVVRKIHHTDEVGSLNSDQFLLSLLTFPKMWMQVTFIHQPSHEVSQLYNISQGKCSYAELFDSNGFYKLEQQVKRSHSQTPSKRTKLDKEIIKLDERINILHQLINNKLLKVYPQKDDSNHQWYASGDDLSTFSSKDSTNIIELNSAYIHSLKVSLKTNDWSDANAALRMIKLNQEKNNTTLNLNENTIKAELLFNKLDIFQHCKKAYLILGGILILLTFSSFLSRKRWQIYFLYVLISLVIIAMLFQLFGLILRGYIGGYAPWSNSYETMIYISFISIVAGLIFVRQSKITFALSTLFAGIILFVAGLNWLDPQISTLVPVLKSPWLMIHVAVIVAGYSFFGVSCLLGITNLSLLIFNRENKLSNRIEELSIINEMSLLIGLALMTIGTFLGAVWANESWGRYWGWDSKETWALITILVYAIITHLRLVRKWDNPWILNISSILAFLSVLMTYFGVNYYLAGLHSYA